jgi:thymidylate kinase
MKPYQLICVTGPDGAGKSTLLENLQKELEGSVITTIWDLLTEPSLREYLPLRSASEIDIYLSKLHSISRSLFLMHCLKQALELAKRRKPTFILADSYWYKYYATEIAHGSSKEYLDKLVSMFEPPDHIFYIDLPEEIISDRKQKYSLYECGFEKERTQEDFRCFQKKAIGELQSLVQGIPGAMFLDGRRTVKENLSVIIDTLKQAACENDSDYRN